MFPQEGLAPIRLKGSKLQAFLRVTGDNELNGAVAKVADTVEKEDTDRRGMIHNSNDERFWVLVKGNSRKAGWMDGVDKERLAGIFRKTPLNHD